MQTFDLAAHLVAQLCVEVGERFVEQEQTGVAHDRAADRDALQLPAGKLARETLQQVVDPEHLRRAPHFGFDFRLGSLARAQPKGDVIEHLHVRIERVVLEHHRDIPIARW